MNTIITEQELLTIAKDIKKINAEIRVTENHIVLSNASVNTFFDFCTEHQIPSFFCDYTYYNRDSLLIHDEMIRRYVDTDAEFTFCKKWADAYNKELCEMDFSNPKELTLAAIYQSIPVIWRATNDWLLDIGIVTPSEALVNYMDSHENELVKLYNSEIIDDSLSLREELRAVLLSSSDFRYCTNRDKRSHYLHEFLCKKENKKYLLIYRNLRLNKDRETRLYDLVDRFYDEYRNACYKNKIPLGEPIPEEEYNE